MVAEVTCWIPIPTPSNHIVFGWDGIVSHQPEENLYLGRDLSLSGYIWKKDHLQNKSKHYKWISQKTFLYFPVSKRLCPVQAWVEFLEHHSWFYPIQFSVQGSTIFEKFKELPHWSAGRQICLAAHKFWRDQGRERTKDHHTTKCPSKPRLICHFWHISSCLANRYFWS